jgi:hypothetical protein
MQSTRYTLRELKEFWEMLFDSAAPADSQWALWFLQHHPNTVRRGIVMLEAKRRRLNGKMDATYMVKYASAAMNLITESRTIPAQNRTEPSSIAV